MRVCDGVDGGDDGSVDGGVGVGGVVVAVLWWRRRAWLMGGVVGVGGVVVDEAAAVLIWQWSVVGWWCWQSAIGGGHV